MDWFVLGIEPTKDKKAITAAYRQKLRQTNPEDAPEEFKALRAAYEEAMALADQNDTESVGDDSPLGIWTQKMEALYWNYASRIDPEQWRMLLRDDMCIALDTRALAEEVLLKFLMENFWLPQNVWAVLDEAFHFGERSEEICETYPRDFVEHVILNGLRLEPALPYALFIPGRNGADCDACIRLYFEANRMEITEIAPILERMDALSESHPYAEALRYRFWMETGKAEEGKAGFRKLAEQYPTEAPLAMAWASICLENDDVEQAERIAQDVLSRDPKNFSAGRTLARCLAKRERYHEAKELSYDLMHSCGGDPVLMDQLAEEMKLWNEQLILQREEKYAASSEDTDNAMELAWCYAQNDRVDDAFELALKIDEEKAEPFTYHNLMGKLYHNKQNFSDALHHLQIVEQIIRDLKPDGTKETEKRIKRLPEMLQIQGNCLMQLQQTDAARKKFEEALEIAPDDPEVLTLMGKILFVTGDYPYAVEILKRLVRVSPGAWHGEFLLAFSLYRMRQDREAFDALNRAMAIQGSDLSLYILKIQILIRNGVWDEVHAMLDFLKESGAPEDISIDFINAQLTQFEAKDEKRAFQQYQQIARRLEKGELMLVASELYYHMAVLMGNQMDAQSKEDREILIAQIDKGLEHDPHDADCLAYKAWLLKQGGQIDEAIEMYRNLEMKNPNSSAVQKGLASLYYDNIETCAQEALSYYEKLLEKQKTPETFFYAATCKRHMGDMEGARKYYLKELEMDPDDIDGYRGLAFICDAEGKYEQSLEYLNQAISIMESYEQEYIWLIEHKVQTLRRMNRFEEALECVDAAMKRYNYAGGFQLKCDICCQFGLWDRAKAVLDAWKKANAKDPNLMAASAKFYILTGKMFKAAVAMGPAKHKLPFEQVQDFRLQLADLECNTTRQVQIWGRRAKQNPGDDFAMMNFALALWRAGKQDAARQIAEKALALLDELLKQNLTNEALCRSGRCQVLAILGREDEARAELERTRKLPLCHHCEYCSCKDADIYEASIEEIFGNKEKALELYRAGRKNWPDDSDFIAGEARLGRKGKK